MRELLRAMYRRKPSVALVDYVRDRGGMTPDQVLARLLETHPWPPLQHELSQWGFAMPSAADQVIWSGGDATPEVAAATCFASQRYARVEVGPCLGALAEADLDLDERSVD